MTLFQSKHIWNSQILKNKQSPVKSWEAATTAHLTSLTAVDQNSKDGSFKMKCSDLRILLKVDLVYSVHSAVFYPLCSQAGVLCAIALFWRLKETINLCHGEWFPHFAEPKAQSHSVTRSVGSDRLLVP